MMVIVNNAGVRVQTFGSAEIADNVTTLAKIDAAYSKSAQRASTPAAAEQLVARM
jgi:hypothetical protein